MNSGKQGLDPRKSSLRIGIFGAEPGPTRCARKFGGRLDLHAVDIYGLSESWVRRRQRMCGKQRTASTSGKITSIRR